MPVTGNKTLNNYKLSIRAYADGFSFSVINLLDGTVMRQEDARAEAGECLADVLVQMLQRPRLTNYRYSKVELLIDTPATIVPLEQFRREDVPVLYRLNFPQSTARRNEITYDMLPALEVVVLYALDIDVRTTLTDMYPDVTVRSALSATVERAYAMSRKGDTGRVEFYAFVEPRLMNLCSFRQGHLHFASTYDVSDDADRLYFLLSLWKTLEMDGEVDTCYLSGASQHLQAEIQRFINNVESCG